MTSLKNTLRAIKLDFPEGKFRFTMFLKSYFYSPRFRVLLNYRIGNYFYSKSNFFLRQIGVYYRVKLITKRNCEISYGATIGRNLKLPHPIGIVVGDGVIIKDNVMLFQQVTLGSHGKKGDDFSYPVIENDVKVYSGAKIIGGVTIGKGAIVGANAVVNIDVPSNSVAVGVPCKIIEK